MSTDLVVPLTGEVIPLDAPTDVLARARDELRDLLAAITTYRNALDAELVRRFDEANEKSLRVAGLMVKVDAPMEWVTDGVALRAELLKLAWSTGALSTDAVDAALPEVVSVKPHRMKLKALHEHPDPRVREVVKMHDRRVDKAYRRVTVSVDR